MGVVLTVKCEMLWNCPDVCRVFWKATRAEARDWKGDVLAFLNAPDDYDRLLGKLPDEVTVARGQKRQLDFIQLFATERASLEREFPRLKARLKQDGMIWVSWPKSSSRLRTDLSDGVVREVGLKNRPGRRESLRRG
jgi:hypothetical protein